jgi:hypothetical protein
MVATTGNTTPTSVFASLPKADVAISPYGSQQAFVIPEFLPKGAGNPGSLLGVWGIPPDIKSPFLVRKGVRGMVEKTNSFLG